ncbi:hypothetical protein BBTM_01921 [Bifidobacterium bifidum]|nr:hypothetical protein BBTM_01921 [Bifidobacterium bifidum]
MTLRIPSERAIDIWFASDATTSFRHVTAYSAIPGYEKGSRFPMWRAGALTPVEAYGIVMP